MISKFVINPVNFAVSTIFGDADQNFTQGVSNLPAWASRVEISRAFLVDIFGAVH